MGVQFNYNSRRWSTKITPGKQTNRNSVENSWEKKEENIKSEIKTN